MALPVGALIAIAQQYLGPFLGQFIGGTEIPTIDDILNMGEDVSEQKLREGLYSLFTNSLKDRVAELKNEPGAPEGFFIGKTGITKKNKKPHTITEEEWVHRVMFDLLRDEVFTMKGGGRVSDRFRDKHLPGVIKEVAADLDENDPPEEAIKMVARALANAIF